MREEPDSGDNGRPDLTYPVISALSRFIAHDVTTSLRFARINLDNLVRAVETGNQEAMHRQLESLRARIDGAERILERVREYGRIVEFDTSPMLVNIPFLAADLQRIASGKGFTFEFGGQPLEIRTSRAPLRLALTELVMNAVDHHDRPPGRVQLTWEALDGRIRFQVIDDVPGIPREDVARIFDFGATLGPRNPLRHAGLGLCIVAHLLTTLGQDYGIESDAPLRRGTKVFMTWPAVWPLNEGPARAGAA